MFRYEVPVDDQIHAIELTGHPVQVAHGAVPVGSWRRVVEFWAEYDDSHLASEWRFQVFGTGHALPERAVHAGTTPRSPEGLVWHLYLLPH